MSGESGYKTRLSGFRGRLFSRDDRVNRDSIELRSQPILIFEGEYSKEPISREFLVIYTPKLRGFERGLFLSTGAILMTLGSGAIAPVRAASLEFSFTTEGGATGSFTLDPDTLPVSEPSVGAGPGLEGILYPNAVSNFSLSTPIFDISNNVADYELIPALTFPSPSGATGVLSGVVFPSGCSATTTDFSCLLTIGVVYTGQTSDLAADPASYPTVLSVETLDPETGGIERDVVTNFQVSRIPEPSSGLGILVFGVSSWLWKRWQKK